MSGTGRRFSEEEEKFFAKLFSSQTSPEEREDSLNKYEALVQMLLAAGYFRTRISTLSPFDKLIGGLCWSITASGVGVDVDILFEENMKLGRKIQLSETIVVVLRRMRCPFPLQANQIQGCDFNALYPVIRWLVHKVIETREQMGDVNRFFSEYRFDSAYSLPDPSRTLSADFLGGVTERFRPRRRYRRSKDMWARTMPEEARVQSCLLEYGDKVGTAAGDDAGGDDAAGSRPRAGSASSDSGGAGAGAGPGRRGSMGGALSTLSAFEKKFAAAQKEAEAEATELQRQAAAREAHMLKLMADVKGDKGLVLGSNVAGIVGLRSEEIRAASADYAAESEATRVAAESREPITRRGRVAAHLRRKAALERQLQTDKARADAVQEEVDLVQARTDKLRRTRDKGAQYVERVVAETKKLEEIESSSEHAGDLAKLRQLVELNESLKTQETAFKAMCKQHMGELQAQLKKAEAGSHADPRELARLQEIEEMYEEVKSKYDRGRQLLARRTRDAAAIARKIDDVPTRTELIQYERRFVELYEQVAAKLEETRKYFSTYNTLEQMLGFMNKEVSLLQSVNDQLEQAMKSRSSREALVDQMQGIIEGLRKTMDHQQVTHERGKQKLSAAEFEYQKLVEEQRQYFKCVKEFQEECDVNEKLAAEAQSKGVRVG